VEFGARDQVGGAQVVEKLRVREPPAPAHDLFFHHRDVGGGAAEGGGAELEEEESEFPE